MQEELTLDELLDLEDELADAYVVPEGMDAEEAARRDRIANGEEAVCMACGCSDSRACEGGCVWATETLCSRCV
jgi:hypothetical protein